MRPEQQMVVGDKELISPTGPDEGTKCSGNYFMSCKVMLKEGPEKG